MQASNVDCQHVPGVADLVEDEGGLDDASRLGHFLKHRHLEVLPLLHAHLVLLEERVIVLVWK